MAKKVIKKTVGFTVRDIPNSVMEHIKKESEKTRRSINSQILIILDEWIER